MTLFKWHVVKAGNSWYVRKRMWYFFWSEFRYADAKDEEFFWGTKEFILKYCQFKNEADAIEKCNVLNELCRIGIV